MKKKKNSKKLVLNKETIENLVITEEKAVKGGAPPFITNRVGLACMSYELDTCPWTCIGPC